MEKPVGVVVAFGGQTAIRLTQYLDSAGIPILGTSAEGIDIAEDRERFDELLEKFGIRRPKGAGVRTLEEALAAAETLGYPVLLRPSYVIGGQNMTIVHEPSDVRRYMRADSGRRHREPGAGGQVHARLGAGGGRDLRRQGRAHSRRHGAH